MLVGGAYSSRQFFFFFFFYFYNILMATKGFVLYLLTAFSVAVFSAFFFVNNNFQNASNNVSPSLLSSSNAGSFGLDDGSDEKVWPVRFFSSLSQSRFLSFTLIRIRTSKT